MFKISIIKITIILSVLTVNSSIDALRCYACSITSANMDMKCLNDPISVEGQSIVNCNKKYCTILRQELKDPPGKINSFVRGCEEKPILLNEVIDDPTFRTYYRSCSQDLCNDGDALKAPGEEKISPDGYDGENLLVPGLSLKGCGLVFQGNVVGLLIGIISGHIRWIFN